MCVSTLAKWVSAHDRSRLAHVGVYQNRGGGRNLRLRVRSTVGCDVCKYVCSSLLHEKTEEREAWRHLGGPRALLGTICTLQTQERVYLFFKPHRLYYPVPTCSFVGTWVAIGRLSLLRVSEEANPLEKQWSWWHINYISGCFYL